MIQDSDKNICDDAFKDVPLTLDLLKEMGAKYFQSFKAWFFYYGEGDDRICLKLKVNYDLDGKLTAYTGIDSVKVSVAPDAYDLDIVKDRAYRITTVHQLLTACECKQRLMRVMLQHRDELKDIRDTLKNTFQ